DVDVLDGVIERAIVAGHRLLEGIEVHDDEVDRFDARLADRRHVRGRIAPREEAAVDLGVQGLDPAVQHLRVAGGIGDLGDRYAVRGEQLRRTAAGEDRYAEGRERPREIDDPRLVGDADQRLPDADVHRLARRASA